MKSASPHPVSYRPDIDGLRAVAVLSVVCTHLGIFVRGGYVGVDVFFVISGFLITRLIRRDLEAGAFSLADFWERRLRRIFPALAAVALATLLAGWFFLLPEAYAGLGRSLAAVSLLVSNFHFWLDQDYFAAANRDKPLLHTWSLAVEEQFYLCVPLFLAWLGGRGKLKQALPWLAGLTAASLVLSILLLKAEPGATFYLLPTRAWELFAGSLLALGAPRWNPKPGKALGWLSGLGLLLILVPVVLYRDKTPFPGLMALPPVLGTALLVWTGSVPGPAPAVNRWLSSRGMVAIGLWSYSIYLWHWPLFVYLRSQSIGEVTAVQKGVLLAATLVLGYVSWRWVETPFRQRRLLGTRRSLVGASAAVFTLMLACGICALQAQGFPARMPPEVQPILASIQRPERYITRPQPEDVPGRLKRFGKPGGPEALVVWGDSHAISLLPAIDAAAADLGLSVVAATRPATPPVVGYYPGPEAVNERYNRAVLDYLRSAGIRKVFMTALWSEYRRPSFRSALFSTLDELRRAGVQVYLMCDVPRYPFEVPRALVVRTRYHQGVSDLSIPVQKHLRENRVLLGWVPELRRRGVHVLDPIPLLLARTGTERLFPFDAGGSFYLDTMHLSPHGAGVLRPLFDEVLAAGPTPKRPPSLPRGDALR